MNAENLRIVFLKERIDVSLNASQINAIKKAPTVEGVLPVFHERWSARSFADREVAPETLKKVFEAARWAASAYQKIFASLIEFNQSWARTAPVLILGAAKTSFTHNGTENGYAIYDLGAASSYLTLEAAALGLTTHQMAGYDQAKARQAFDIPAEYALGAVIALGYQGEPAALGNEQLIAREIEPRDRKPLSEIALSAWDEPAKL
jgi:nitroreductase